MRNLTDNAARYTPLGGTVDIRIKGDIHQVRYEYINNAGELVADDLPFLFERFSGLRPPRTFQARRVADFTTLGSGPLKIFTQSLHSLYTSFNAPSYLLTKE